MNIHDWQRISAHADKIYDQWSDLMESDKGKELVKSLEALANDLPDDCMVNQNFTLDVFSEMLEKSLPILQVGHTASKGGKPREFSSDSTPMQYWAEGKRCVVPHDYCAICWSPHDFKTIHPECPGCGATLGRDVFLLVDGDSCPHCHEGTVTRKSPCCTECGTDLNPEFVHWG